MVVVMSPHYGHCSCVSANVGLSEGDVPYHSIDSEELI